MQKKTVLIIDDDPSIREIYMMSLELDGHHVLEAENGSDAINLLSRCSSGDLPHCIILDLTMPVLNGQGFLNYIENYKKETWGEIPVIIVSAFGEFSRTNQVKDFLEKPVSVTSLINIVEHTTQHISA